MRVSVGVTDGVGVTVAGTCTCTWPCTREAATLPSLRSPRVKVRAEVAPAAPTARNWISSSSPAAVTGCAPARAALITPGVAWLTADAQAGISPPRLTPVTVMTAGS